MLFQLKQSCIFLSEFVKSLLHSHLWFSVLRESFNKRLSLLTVNFISKQFSVYIPIWIVEDTTYQKPGRFFILEVYGLSDNTKAGNQNKQYNKEVTHVSQLKIDSIYEIFNHMHIHFEASAADTF